MFLSSPKLPRPRSIREVTISDRRGRGLDIHDFIDSPNVKIGATYPARFESVSRFSTSSSMDARIVVIIGGIISSRPTLSPIVMFF